MDFSNLQLRRDMDIVLLNGREDAMFPLGSLREPLSAMRRSHLVVLMGEGTVPPAGCQQHMSDKPVFHCRVIPTAFVSTAGCDPVDPLPKKSVVLVSGIAHPERFRRTAEEIGLRVKRHVIFRDHHEFTDKELRQVLDEAGGLPLVFTEKDWVRLPAWTKDREDVAALRIGLVMENEPEFKEMLARSLSEAWPEMSARL